MKRRGILISLSIALTAVLTAWWWTGRDEGPSYAELVDAEMHELPVDTVPSAPSVFGTPVNDLLIEPHVVGKGATLADILIGHGVPYARIDSLVKLAEPVFNVKHLRRGRPYTLFLSNDTLRSPHHLVYEIDKVEYIVFTMTDSLQVRRGSKPVEVIRQTVSCPVQGALYNDLAARGADPTLSLVLAEAFAWTVDFYRIQKGDVFTAVYEEQRVDGERFGMPRLLAARYVSDGRAVEGFAFQINGNDELFDADGNSLRKAFLKAPLKFSRITSGYSGRRFHPIQRRFKAHRGTDYAAPRGTPIMSVGDGVVEQTGYTRGNGNYVKVRHNATYTTQYLHMSKIIAKRGQRVTQGETIGLVGSTGLATGPHVCFRFWKNGVQVDHRRESFPSAEPIPQEQLPAFYKVRDPLQKELDATDQHPVDTPDLS